MRPLSEFITLFQKLRRAPNRSFPSATLQKAPHKPFLLLAIMDLIQRKVITTPFIDIRGDLDELIELFDDYWNALFGATQASSIAFPFSRLNSEPFWELVPIDKADITATTINGVSSVNQLRSVAIGARLDGDLFRYMVNFDSREVLVKTILESCFSPEGRQDTGKVIALHQGAFQYELFLEEKVQNSAIREPQLGEGYCEARNRGFRLAIIKNYDKRCALCGVRIITPEGRSVVDAAHIVPWSKSKDDSIGNGMALCKLCHWSFDNGLIGVSERYKIILSDQMSRYPNAAGLLITLNSRDIVGPTVKDFWPKPENLSWHRNHWGLQQ
jgi:putative restriction endonuclease